LNKEEKFIVLTTSLAHGFIHAYGLILPALLLLLTREFEVGTTEMGVVPPRFTALPSVWGPYPQALHRTALDRAVLL
jgi:hypothetical protein